MKFHVFSQYMIGSTIRKHKPEMNTKYTKQKPKQAIAMQNKGNPFAQREEEPRIIKDENRFLNPKKKKTYYAYPGKSFLKTNPDAIPTRTTIPI